MQHTEELRREYERITFPSRRRALAARDYRGALEALLAERREIAEGMQSLVDNYIVVAEFSETVAHLFRERATTAAQEAQAVEVILEDISRPRKIPLSLRTSADIRDRRLNLEAKAQPLEHENATSPGNWQPAKFLGGGLSLAVLWVRLDENGVIQRRVVRKDTPVSQACWTDCTVFHGNLRDPDTRLPLEFHIQKTLQDRPESYYVLPVYKQETDIKRMLYRMYFPYCPYGDLARLISCYSNEREAMPEPWLWRVFEALALAGLVMEKGGCNEHLDDWLQVVHRDIKPHNIFLDVASEQTYPRYPVPKLADFGLAFQTWPDDPFNPLMWSDGTGTPGQRAPEQMAFIDEETGEPVDAFKLLSATNVWAVGVVMWQLVHRMSLDAEDELDFVERKELAIDEKKTDCYSRELLQAIQSCMRFDPADRITFQSLYDGIQAFKRVRAEDGSDDLGMYLALAQTGVQNKHPLFDLKHIRERDYQLGMAFTGPEWEDEAVDELYRGSDSSAQTGAGYGHP